MYYIFAMNLLFCLILGIVIRKLIEKKPKFIKLAYVLIAAESLALSYVMSQDMLTMAVLLVLYMALYIYVVYDDKLKPWMYYVLGLVIGGLMIASLSLVTVKFYVLIQGLFFPFVFLNPNSLKKANKHGIYSVGILILILFAGSRLYGMEDVNKQALALKAYMKDNYQTESYYIYARNAFRGEELRVDVKIDSVYHRFEVKDEKVIQLD